MNMSYRSELNISKTTASSYRPYLHDRQYVFELPLFYIFYPKARQKQYAYVDKKSAATNKTDIHHALRGREI